MNKKNLTGISTNVSASDFSAEIIGIIRSNLAPGKMLEEICKYHENDIAITLSSLTKDECQRLFRILFPEKIANVLEYAESNVYPELFMRL